MHFFALVLHDYNVKLPETDWLHVLCRKCRTCSCSFFSLPLIFTLVAASISYFPTAATKVSCCSSNRKNVSFVFYLSLCLSLFFSLSFAGLSPAFSFSLSLFRQKNLKLPYLYFYIGMPVVGTDGRAGGCTVTWLPKFLGCTGYQIFLPKVLRCARESSVNIKAVNYALFLPNHIADLLICC